MLSIVIPTLNEEKYLPVLLEEIKKQDFSDYEIIVADAGSKDKTVRIAKSYGCRVVPGGLPARGRNEGAKMAEGDLILFLDADMIYFPPDFFRMALEQFKQRGLDVATCSICANGSKFDKFIYGVYNFWTKITQNFTPHAADVILVRKEAHQKVGGFDETIKLAEDIDYARRINKIGRFGFLNTPPVLTSSRRLEQDGRLRTCFKFILAGLHIAVFGPIRTDIFKYRFNHYSKDKTKE